MSDQNKIQGWEQATDYDPAFARARPAKYTPSRREVLVRHARENAASERKRALDEDKSAARRPPLR
jgi:hypothetical protein